MTKMNGLKYFTLAVGLILTVNLHAGETLKVNLRQADSLFLARNFNLLASSMNIESQKALVIQARLYPNPVLALNFNAYDPENKKVFHNGQSGDKSVQFQQLIVLGGKRKSEIEMAKTNEAIAELQFQDLLRQLKFKLHSALFAIGQQRFLLDKYNNQMALLDTISIAYQIQVDKGNIPLKELVRLKGAILKLSDDRSDLLKQYYDNQADLQKLLQSSAPIEFEYTENEISKYIRLFTIEELKAEAMANRPDLLIMDQNKTLARQYLQFQKKLAIPDINFNTAYDQRSGAFRNEITAGIEIPIPVWNHNQGNIKASQFKLDQAEYDLLGMKNEIMGELQGTYSFYSETVLEYQKASKLYNQDFEITLKGMIENFQKRNVSMIEFVDFLESYNEVLTELVRVKIQLVESGEEINQIVGKDI